MVLNRKCSISSPWVSPTANDIGPLRGPEAAEPRDARLNEPRRYGAQQAPGSQEVIEKEQRGGKGNELTIRGPSTQDCEKSFARTGLPSANLLAKAAASQSSSGSTHLVQITRLQTPAVPALLVTTPAPSRHPS